MLLPARTLVIPAAALFAAGSPASALVIDSFDDGAFALTLSGDVDDRDPQIFDRLTSTGNTGNILGGSRQARLDLRDGRGVVDARTLGAVAGVGGVGGSGDSGVLSVSNSSRAYSDFFLGYENFTSFDLTEGGTQSAFLIDYSFFQGFSIVTATVDTGSGRARLAARVEESNNDRVVGDAERANSQQVVLAFADFDGTADFSDVGGVKFLFESLDTDLGGATDFEIDSISTIPEPASLALVAAGACLLAGGRGRRA